MIQSPRYFLLLSAAIVLGALAAHALMPFLFGLTISDMERARVLLGALGDPADPPSACVFGNSVVMSGIDARRMSEELPGHPLVWNLSSGGQDLFESYLYYQELPESVRVVVQCVFAGTLEQDFWIESNKYNALYMYGYRPNEETLSLTDACASPEMGELLRRSNLHQRFQGRWALRSTIDAGLRQFLRKDLAFSRAMENLYYPSINHTKLSPSAVANMLSSLMPARGPAFEPSERATAFLLRLNEACRARQRKLVIVVLPERPEFIEYYGEQFSRQLDEYCRNLEQSHDLPTINCLRLFEADANVFADACHTDETGARRLTDRVASELERLRACSSIPQNSSSSR